MNKKSLGEHIFGFINTIIMLCLIIITAYPVYYVAVCAFSDSSQLLGERGLMLLPKGISLDAFKSVFNNPNILTGYRTTLFVVIVGTCLSVLMTSFGAFLITRKKFAVKNVLSYLMVFTMFFNGGMIPTYLCVYKWLGLGNSVWALIFPAMINTYNLLIMKSNFQSIPYELEEAASIDGVNDIQLLFKIILPLSKSIIAVMVLFYGVSYWNSWFSAMMYLRDRDKYPLQLILREILFMNNMSGMNASGSEGDQYMLGESIKYATIVVATIPILLVYPFLQKFFVKGVMVGAVKG